MIENQVKQILKEIEKGNNLGEPITLVGATKYVSVENINEGIKAGLKDIGENKPQEFRDKFTQVLPVNYHFFGRLQKNKVKYLIGKTCLIHSVDSVGLLEEINNQSLKNNVVTNILLEVNLGEEQKAGFTFLEVEELLPLIKDYQGVNLQGLMAMLPDTDNEELKINLLDNLREFYDKHKVIYNFKFLSVGMSGDYSLAIKHGSNMIRVGSKIFGARY